MATSFFATCPPGCKNRFYLSPVNMDPPGEGDPLITIADGDCDGVVSIDSRRIAAELVIRPGNFVFADADVVSSGLLTSDEITTLRAGGQIRNF